MGLYVVLLAILCAQWTGLVESGAQVHAGCSAGGGVDMSENSQEQRIAQQLQFEVSCDGNSTARSLFVDSVKAEFGITRSNYHTKVPIFHVIDETCRSATHCSGSNNNVTWCINVYHPTEHVQICMDETGIINQTDYALLLQLECFFRVPKARDCTSHKKNCLQLTQPVHMLDRSVLTCNTRNEQTGCSSTTATILNVEVTGRESLIPKPVFENKTELVLGQTNVFLCEVSFTEGRFYSAEFARWSVDGVLLEKIHEQPFCTSREDCLHDTRADTRDDRIRAYEERYTVSRCPIPILLHREWLWIDQATLEDTNRTFTCSGHTTFTNPFPREVVGSLDVIFTPVFPVIPVEILEVPYALNSSEESASLVPNPPSLNLTVDKGQSFHLTCAAIAGVEDHLVWLLDGQPVPYNTSDPSEDFVCPPTGPGSLHVIHRPVDVLEQYVRGYNTTLVACNFSLALTGHYQCLLNRTRAESIVMWEATLYVPQFPDETNRSAGLSVPTRMYLGIAGGILFIILVLASLLLYVKYRRRKRGDCRDISTLNPVNPIFFADTEVTSFTEAGRDLQKKLEGLEQPLKSVAVDPLEFPRGKLEMTGVVLGEGSFGRVLQARAEGIVKGLPDRNIVAVKACREKAANHEVNELWEELKLMKQMKPHKNIINLLGHCTLPNGPLYVIIEFAIHGSLKDYLHECREAICKLNHTPYIGISRRGRLPSLTPTTSSPREKIPLSQQSSVFSDISATSCSPLLFSPTCVYPEARTRCVTLDSGFVVDSPAAKETHFFPVDVTTAAAQDYINCRGILYMEDVLNFALQIACGLQHLGELKIAHCDLAARNILIAEGFVLKIGDFGMARDISDGDYYRKLRDGHIPVKWSAPEVLEKLIFTHQSDVWSYGVVLWEILTYSQKPYPDQTISYSWDSFINYLKAGNRLPQPEGCPTPIYDLMLSCWQLSPHHRPTATQLTQLLSKPDDTASLVSSKSWYSPAAAEQAIPSQKSSQEFPDPQNQ